ncbi:sulfite exporter TauE/SafE family protein [Acinetobacter sp. YH12239]|uniref:sulfite exporter TauE/SafE family protein n=1 Tax=Acinetobacter sp. YH12239 TaxID=2601166 RepID=UPI0015D1F1F8|nr:sulfite exporter TauE/SafE family protein [Acinetobacter sp. YH12239]
MAQSEWMVLWLCALAALLHGLSGFGFPMMSTAVLSTQLPLSLAVTLVILPCLILNLILLTAHPHYSIWQSIQHYSVRFFPLILSSLVGSLLGVKLLLWLNEGYLKLLLGMVMVLYVIDQLRQHSFTVSPSVLNMLIFGLLAGIIGGATNAMAPFLMMYLLSCQLSKTDIVIVSNLSFIGSKLIQILLLYPILVNIDEHQQLLVMLICVFAIFGVWIGGWIRQHISQQFFKNTVLILLLLLGIQALWQSYNLLEQSISLFK